MLLQSILNRVEPINGFVYESVYWQTPKRLLMVQVRARKGSRPICSGCGRKGPGYDRLPARTFEYVPLWGMAVWFHYALRRVDCRHCHQVTAERVSWAHGKERATTSLQWFLARWSRKLSWKEVATTFGVSWETVYRSVKMAVCWGLRHRSLEKIKAIGVDEVAYRKGHNYLTLVYQIDEGGRRLLWIGRDRTKKTLRRFFRVFGKRRSKKLKYLCSDMWKPYLSVIAKEANQAIHILDRFHIMQMFNKALDKVRAEEARALKRDGYVPVLKNARWSLLKRKANLTRKQTVRLRELLRYNLKTVKCYLMKEDFQRFWNYKSRPYAARFLFDWCDRAKRSRVEPIKKLAKTLNRHCTPILNWFEGKGAISTGAVEGLNNKVKLVMRRSYGFRGKNTVKYALYHTLGKLPEPKFTHEFC